MSWFKESFGFVEADLLPSKVREKFSISPVEDGDGDELVCPNNKRYQLGQFDVLSAKELREITPAAPTASATQPITFKNIVGDVRSFHTKYSAEASTTLIQAASQFNCLEMVGPYVTPDKGVTMYVRDHTQGPACALSCPAATVYRNYFVNGRGQCEAPCNQINTLRLVDELIDRKANNYFEIKNGYAWPPPGKMAELTERLSGDEALCENIRQSVQAGVHWNTEVKESGKKICQVFASATPVAYVKNTKSADWKLFSKLVLDGMYEATLAAAVKLQRERGGRIRVVLTLLGGGAFGNNMTWILDAIERACVMYKDEPLDIELLHYSPIQPRSRFHELGERILSAI
ncbi:hypothetical protein TL16_g00662 [Triparma laevis f. inornata]|uniref:Macro domain-containing protein n=1 Tax=Triparma laevis f. inornata TaxID=1714386 RepID=A0A9W6ZD22_9STRA|nr:hypothetical protein TL16_g00662 [Triparma laevis f. inornata]